MSKVAPLKVTVISHFLASRLKLPLCYKLQEKSGTRLCTTLSALFFKKPLYFTMFENLIFLQLTLKVNRLETSPQPSENAFPKRVKLNISRRKSRRFTVTKNTVTEMANTNIHPMMRMNTAKVTMPAVEAAEISALIRGDVKRG